VTNNNKRSVLIHHLIPLVAAAALLGASGAQAAALNLTSRNPDVNASGVSLAYTGSTGAFDVNSVSDSVFGYMDPAGSFQFLTGGSYSLTATLDGSGNLTGGSVTIDGTIGSMSGPLLQGKLTDFGYTSQASTTKFEFLADNLSGALVDNGDFAGRMGIIMNTGGTGTSGSSFSIGSDFSQTLNTDNYNVVPIPAAAWLFGSGLVALVGIMRRRQIN